MVGCLLASAALHSAFFWLPPRLEVLRPTPQTRSETLNPLNP